MYRILKFYKTYPILTTVLSELSWSHYLELIDIDKQDERQFYEVFSVKESWSVRQLQDKIKTNEYSNFKDKGLTTKYTVKQLPTPGDVFKNTYHWNFINLEEEHSERELEDALLSNIQNVLLEFGNGFAFLGRQQKININNQWHKIDLLFYHILLKCHIIVELKARKLQEGDITQVTKYLTYFREHKIQGDRDPISLIICKSYDHIDVYYSAGKDFDDIFVAEYKTKLPTENQIVEKLTQL
jgi:predicted nuclease of restriction endonuclease-like (RecB) superfamily